MKLATHRFVQPALTTTAIVLLSRYGNLSYPLHPFLMAGACSIVGNFSCNGPDADIYAEVPSLLFAKNGTTKMGKSGPIYASKELNMRIWGLIHLCMGQRAHRKGFIGSGFSHSFLFWTGLWTGLIYWCYTLPPSLIQDILLVLFFGLGLGYLGHLFGDTFIKSSVPILFYTKIPNPFSYYKGAYSKSISYNLFFAILCYSMLFLTLYFQWDWLMSLW